MNSFPNQMWIQYMEIWSYKADYFEDMTVHFTNGLFILERLITKQIVITSYDIIKILKSILKYCDINPTYSPSFSRYLHCHPRHSGLSGVLNWWELSQLSCRISILPLTLLYCFQCICHYLMHEPLLIFVVGS